MYRYTISPPPPAEPDTRPRYLVEGWHELAIDRCLYRRGPPLFEHRRRPLFVVEGIVRRSTAPGFAGVRWAHVCALRWAVDCERMKQIARVSGNPDIVRVANQAELCIRYDLDWSDCDVRINPLVVLADTVVKKLKHSSASILATIFTEIG